MKFTDRNQQLLLQYIEAVLEMEGEVAPVTLVSRCGIGRTKASQLIKQYQTMEIENLRSHDKKKVYVKTSCYKRVVLKSSASDFIQAFERLMNF